MKNIFTTAAVLSLGLGHVWVAHAQSTTTWGLSAGMNRYTEAKMKLVGPEVGVHAQVLNLFPNAPVQLEGDVLLGKQNYSSTETGSMRNVGNIETRWRIMGEVFADSGFSAGLGVHTLWNDLQGVATDSSGQKFNGYQRSARQLWLPLRWAPGGAWTYELGRLISGQHTSALSQADAIKYTDITNKQKRGTYLQASVSLGLPNGDRFSPFFRYTHLSDSDTVMMAGDPWIEPNNHRLQAGVMWQFASP